MFGMVAHRTMELWPTLAVLASLVNITAQTLLGPKYRTYTRECGRNSDCAGAAGEVCWWLYRGCALGVCMCQPGTHVQHSSGLCKPRKLGLEKCTEEDACPDYMSCRNGTCQCERGVMNEHADLCILPHQRTLGQSCDPSSDQCFHRASYGYTTSNTWCSGGKCRCKEGYKHHKHQCKKLQIGDFGCTKAFHCQGGAICAEERCVCPTGYRAVSKGTKCSKNGAITGLEVGSRCDEVNENRYCGHGLVCHRCAGKRPHKCVKFLLSQGESSYLGSSAHIAPSRASLLGLVSLVLVYISLVLR